MYFCTALVISNAPRRCTPMTVSQSSSVILNRRLSRITPALFTSTFGSPKSAAPPPAAPERAAARVGDFLDRPGARGLVQVQDRHGHPVRGQPSRRRGTDTAGRTGHDR